MERAPVAPGRGSKDRSNPADAHPAGAAVPVRRELRQTAALRASRSRFKIYYIDEVHMLSPGAFNALLKTLEEPPPHVKFFFATTEPNKIPPTVLSRCQRYDFAGITPVVIGTTL